MAKFLILISIYALLVATTVSFPAIDGDSEAQVVDTEKQAVIALADDGNPEYVIVGDGVGRADFSKITNLFNFTAYLEGRQPNVTQLSFVPLITILSNLNG